MAFTVSTLLIVLACYLTNVVFDGIEDVMMRLDSKPTEGWAYRRNIEIKQSLPGLVVLWVLSGLIIFSLVSMAFRRKN